MKPLILEVRNIKLHRLLLLVVITATSGMFAAQFRGMRSLAKSAIAAGITGQIKKILT